MLFAARSRNLPLLQESLKCAGVSMEVRRFKLALRQIKSIASDDQWLWLQRALKELHRNSQQPRNTMYTRYLQEPKPKDQHLSVVINSRITSAEYEQLRVILREQNLTAAEFIRQIINERIQVPNSP